MAEHSTLNLLEEQTYSQDALVTPEPTKAQRVYDQGWTKVLKRRHVYAHSAVNHVSTADRGPHGRTRSELETGALVIEHRVQAQLRLQHQLLVRWRNAILPFQSLWRRYLARRQFQSLLWQARRECIERHVRQCLALRALERTWCALCLTRNIRAYARGCKTKRVSRLVLERATRLYLFRQARARASSRLSRWYRACLLRRRIAEGLARIVTLVRARAQEAKLHESMSAFHSARRRHVEFRQGIYFQMKPEAVLLQRMMEERKAQLRQGRGGPPPNVSKKLKRRKQHKKNNRRGRKIQLSPLEQACIQNAVPLASDAMLAIFHTQYVPSTHTNCYEFPITVAPWMQHAITLPTLAPPP